MAAFSKPFYHFTERLLAGDFTGIDEITVAPCLDFGSMIDPVADPGEPAGLGQAEYLDAWLPYIQVADVEVATLTTSFPGSAQFYQWAIPDLVFNVGTTIDPVGGLLFYWDTGTPATSPLIGLEAWDAFASPIPFTSGVDFTWFAPTYLVRWTHG